VVAGNEEVVEGGLVVVGRVEEVVVEGSEEVTKRGLVEEEKDEEVVVMGWLWCMWSHTALHCFCLAQRLTHSRG